MDAVEAGGGLVCAVDGFITELGAGFIVKLPFSSVNSLFKFTLIN